MFALFAFTTLLLNFHNFIHFSINKLQHSSPHPMVSIRDGDDALASTFSKLDLEPRRGRLRPLRTKDEVRAALETFEAYVVELPARYAGVIKE